MSRETKPLDNIIISYYNYRRRGNKYVFIKLGREKTLKILKAFIQNLGTLYQIVAIAGKSPLNKLPKIRPIVIANAVVHK